jgi:hypothetical protein
VGYQQETGTLPRIESFTPHHLPRELILMMKTRLLIGALAIAGLVASPLVADAKSKKESKQHSSATSGANMNSTNSTKSPAANPSSQGNVGPGTNNVGGPQPGGR